MKKFLKLSAIVLIILSSCKVTAPLGGFVYKKNVGYYNHYLIEVTSEPSGAIIEWNNQYMGTTPCKIEYSGELSFFSRITLVASPKGSGQYEQIKILKNQVPSKIYFNMYLH